MCEYCNRVGGHHPSCPNADIAVEVCESCTAEAEHEYIGSKYCDDCLLDVYVENMDALERSEFVQSEPYRFAGWLVECAKFRPEILEDKNETLPSLVSKYCYEQRATVLKWAKMTERVHIGSVD